MIASALVAQRIEQPDLHMPGWRELRFHGRAKTDGTIWWWEDQQPDGSIKRHPLQPYTYTTKAPEQRTSNSRVAGSSPAAPTIKHPGEMKMGLTMTRPEKSAEMTALVYAIREAAVTPARDGGLNLTEVINAFGQAFASILVGAYDAGNREVVVSTFPNLVRAYYADWEAIYAAHADTPQVNEDAPHE